MVKVKNARGAPKPVAKKEEPARLGRPPVPKRPDIGERLQERLDRLGLAASGFAAPIEDTDEGGRRKRGKEMRIRDMIKATVQPVPKEEFRSWLERRGVKTPERTTEYVYEGTEKPAWWLKASDSGLEGSSSEPAAVKPTAAAKPLVLAAAQPIAGDPLGSVLRAFESKRLSYEEARGAIVGLVKSGILDLVPPTGSTLTPSSSCRSTSRRRSSKRAPIVRFPTVKRLTGRVAK